MWCICVLFVNTHTRARSSSEKFTRFSKYGIDRLWWKHSNLVSSILRTHFNRWKLPFYLKMTSYELNTPFRTTKKTNADTRSKTSLYGIPLTLVWQPVKSLGRDKKNLFKHENFGLIQECERASSNFLTGLWLGRTSSRYCILQQVP